MTTATAVAAAPATTFAGLFTDLKTEATAFVKSLEAGAIALEHTIVPVVESDIATVLSQFKTVALNTVMSLASAEFNNLTGAQKNAITTNTIVQAAVASGKTIAQQDAQMLAQQAYNALATTLAPAVVAN